MTDPTAVRLPDTLKDDLQATGNVSAYLRESAQRRLRRYREARVVVSAWRLNELRAVLDVLRGHTWNPDLPTSDEIAARMQNSNSLDKWGISESEWDALIDRASHEPIAHALRTIADEFWSEATEHVDL